MGYQKIVVPVDGTKITVNADLSLNVPNNPIIPFIEGDGIGADIYTNNANCGRCCCAKSIRREAFHRMDGSLLR